ncbi:MAG: hypothetical protein G01um10148_561 [Parcubacteria group bacterium Gr01-1014_8]|nr:MAG: hypothetical protein G01um10148_561 [Parcubacteria group bacterium Gr01-1014_8]
MLILTRMFFLAPLFALTLLLLPSAVLAHGGESLTFTSTTTEGYVVDVDIEDGYLEADSFTRIDFGLFKDAARSKSADFTDMWVRIVKKDGSKAGQTLFAGAIAKQQIGGNGFSFVFPEGGVYALSVRYNDASKEKYGDIVGEAEFEFEVLRSPDENAFNVGMEFWVGLMIGAFALATLCVPLFLRRKVP